MSILITTYAPKVVGALLTLAIGLWIIGMITNTADRAMKKSGVDSTLLPFLKSIITASPIGFSFDKQNPKLKGHGFFRRPLPGAFL